MRIERYTPSKEIYPTSNNNTNWQQLIVHHFHCYKSRLQITENLKQICKIFKFFFYMGWYLFCLNSVSVGMIFQQELKKGSHASNACCIKTLRSLEFFQRKFYTPESIRKHCMHKFPKKKKNISLDLEILPAWSTPHTSMWWLPLQI